MEKRALVIGLGISGKSAIKFLLHQGYKVFGVDSRDLKEDVEIKKLKGLGVEISLEENMSLGPEFSLVVTSPGVSSSHALVQEAKKLTIPIMGEAELAFKNIQGRAVAITGTNGKTTVTSLVEHVLKQAGRKAQSLGNIGSPLTEYAITPDLEKIVVAELSSYQLETLALPVFEAAVILNITPDHLDRYSDFTAYAEAKAQIQYCLKPGGDLYVDENAVAQFPSLFKKPFYTMGVLESSFLRLKGVQVWEGAEYMFSLPEEYKELGVHDSLNAIAAWALCKRMGIFSSEFISGLTTFKKPSHRIEFIRTVSGVRYYDDSKGTNVDAVIRAVQSMKGTVTLIAGGVDKGSSYLPWKEAFQGRIRKMILIGEASFKIADELGLFFNVKIVDSLEEAVKESERCALFGECVLLSPGCSSFDMFRDYAHRGKEFQKFVYLLEDRS